MNHLYRQKGSAFPYQKVFTDNNPYNFDEIYGANLICSRNKASWLDFGHQHCLDRIKKDGRLEFYGKHNYGMQAVYWHAGRLFWVVVDDSKVWLKEQMYYHFSGMHYGLQRIEDGVLFFGNTCVNCKRSGLRHAMEIYRSSTNDKYAKFFGGGKKIAWDVKRFQGKSLVQKYISVRQKLAKAAAMWQNRRNVKPMLYNGIQR